MSPVIQDAKNSGMDRNFKGGYLPPTPDWRDYDPSHPKVVEIGEALGLGELGGTSLPKSVDWRAYCTPVEDQRQLGSCTANAVVGVLEYFQKKAHGKYFNGSRRFVYKVTRKLAQSQGDTGSQIRQALGALAIFGVPDEKYWYYTDFPFSGLNEKSDDFKQWVSANYAMSSETFDEEPTAFVYTMAARFKITMYFCHDPVGQNRPRTEVLQSVKEWLATGHPSIFGFSIYHDSFPYHPSQGVDIPYPGSSEESKSAHAVVAVGYDDEKKIRNSLNNTETTGALLIRNSWGTQWGDQGYGWIPYQYVLDGYAGDFWTITGMDWLDTGQFGLTLEDDSYVPVFHNFGTFKVIAPDGLRIRSTPDTSLSDTNILQRGKDTKDRTFKYEMNNFRVIENRIWVEIWNTDHGFEERVGWMCVKEGNNQYTDFEF